MLINVGYLNLNPQLSKIDVEQVQLTCAAFLKHQQDI